MRSKCTGDLSLKKLTGATKMTGEYPEKIYPYRFILGAIGGFIQKLRFKRTYSTKVLDNLLGFFANPVL